MKDILILIDNLRIGGFQRLALDQSYCLSELGYKVTILVLDDDKQKGSLEDLESSLISSHGIDISHIGGDRYIEIIRLRKLLKENSYFFILSHSLRGTIEIWLARFFNFIALKTPIISTIHQLPTLSAPIQRFLRFLYAQFSTLLFAYSKAVKADWQSRVTHFPILLRFLFNKQIEVLRNGIYLNRLPLRTPIVNDSKPRLIYLGRLREWKGLSTYYDLGKIQDLLDFNFLMMVPEISPDQEAFVKSIFGNRIEIVVGKTMAEYQHVLGDVHIYPTNYGDDAKFIESISLNCLEFACLGVPSIVSKGGLATWDDMSHTSVFREVDWTDLKLVANEISIASKKENWNQLEIQNIINVQNNVMQLINVAHRIRNN